MTQDFYRSFEDRHRGSAESVAERQRIYLPVMAAVRSGDSPLLIDVGCGRGEWLQLARAQGWKVQGVDRDAGMLAAARDAGLDVHECDAVQFLASQKEARASAITAFHVAEHLQFEQLQSLLAESRRVLRPGGILIVETPNPENLVVGSSAFFMDPTHVRPLPPALLAFLAEYAGFARVATLRLHEGIGDRAQIELIDVLAGVSPDYAIVAVAPGGSTNPALQELLERPSGVTLNALAQRYDEQLRERLTRNDAQSRMGMEAGVRFAGALRDFEERVQAMERRLSVAVGLEQRAVDRLQHENTITDGLVWRAEQLQRQAEALAERVRAMESSTSWRVTAPLRIAGALPRRSLTAVAQLLNGVPGVKRRVRSVALRLGIVRPLPEAQPVEAPTPSPQPPAMPSPEMTASARLVHDAMLDAARGAPDPGKEP